MMMDLLMILIKIVAILVPLMLGVAYMTYFERKVIAYMQGRVGPNRVGFLGLLQPFADALKLLMKELILPTQANHYLYILAPMLTIGPALAAWAVVPFDAEMVLSDCNIGLLYILALTSISVYGIIIAGWASNSKYAFLGMLRSAAQTISYEIAMGFALVGVVLMAGSMNISAIVMAQQGSIFKWFALPLAPLFVIFWVSAFAETNRSPFDVAEGESEIVAGFHVEYSGIAFAIFFMAEYANMILSSAIAALIFLGGWLSPFAGIKSLAMVNQLVPGTCWLLLKMGFLLFSFIWVRATLPRFRYDQIMRLGWKIFLPLSLLWLCLVAVAIKTGYLA